MVHIYEKKPITYDNEYGIEEITNQDVFKNGPCVIVILGQTCFLSSVNGAMRLVTNLINQNIDDSYEPNKRVFGLGFGNLGIGSFFGEYGEFSESSPTDDELEEFVNTYFLPLVSINNDRIDTMNAMKNIRNINFVTYCDGTKVFKKIEELLENEMKNLGYSNEEIKQILSQVCLAAISGSTIQGDIKATSLLFGDKNDRSFNGGSQLSESKNPFIERDNYFEFVVDGDGNHDFRKYMRDDLRLSSLIKMFLNKALENSAYNYNSNTFIQIIPKKFTNNIINDYNKNKQNEIEYKTYIFKSDQEKMNYLFKVYHNYKKSNDRIDIKNLIEKLELSLYDKENVESNDILLEVAYKNNEVIAFCSHGKDYLYQYEISLMVCSPSYRKNGIATGLFNNALFNISQRGFNSCVIETSKEHDNYDFWISKGAIQIRTRWIEDFFKNIEISLLQLSNIKQYLDNLNGERVELETEVKKLKRTIN